MFRNPGFLVWMIPALLAAGGFSFLAASRRKKLAALLGNPATIGRLIPRELGTRRGLKFYLRLSGLALIFIALAGPQWGVELVSTQAMSNQVMIAVDVSLSMMTPDVRPNRLEKAKGELSLILDGLRGSRAGVIAFAGEAAVLCPITTDIDAAKQILGALEVGAIPQPGTGIGKAIRLAAQTLQRYPGGKALILLSDGEDHKTDPMGAAAEAAAMGIKIYSIGIGTPEGEPIPITDANGAMTEYKKDRKGATVISRLGEQTLKEAAAKTGGAYYRSSPGEIEAQEIVQNILNLDKTKQGYGMTTQYKNRFMIPLALAFLLLLIEMLLPEKKREPREEPVSPKAPAAGTAAFSLLLLLCLPRGALAASAEGALRQGNKFYNQEKFEPALERYSEAAKKNPADPRPVFNAGDALYRLEQYDQAAEAFTALTDPRLPANARAGAYYNLGNVHFQNQDFKQAVEDYRQALTLTPQDPDIRHNLALALRMLKNPPPKKNKQDKKDQKKQEQKKDEKQQPQAPKEDQAKKPEPATRPQDQISKEDAERILRAIAEKEKSAQKQIQKKPVQNKQPDVEEDW